MITHVNTTGFFWVFKGKDINLKFLCIQNSSEIIAISIKNDFLKIAFTYKNLCFFPQGP